VDQHHDDDEVGGLTRTVSLRRTDDSSSNPPPADSSSAGGFGRSPSQLAAKVRAPLPLINLTANQNLSSIRKSGD